MSKNKKFNYKQFDEACKKSETKERIYTDIDKIDQLTSFPKTVLRKKNSLKDLDQLIKEKLSK